MIKKLDKLILLTPFYGDKEILKETVYSVVNQLDENDIWIIVLDNGNIEEYADLKKFKQLILINNRGPKGAGNCRNIGLDYIIKGVSGEFLLLPFDGDDRIVDFGISFLKKKMRYNNLNIVSFGHCKIWPNNTKRIISYSGIFKLEDLLKKYITPCGSTVIKVKDSSILQNFRFSKRFRANDALFFLQAVKYFGYFECDPHVFLNYKIGYSNSLSGKKFRMIYYKFFVFRDFGLNILQISYYLFYYVLLGIRRYYLKQSL